MGERPRTGRPRRRVCRRPPPDGLVQFLENVALVSDVDTMRDEAPGVTLITLHQVKGLEFGVVFIAGMEEGLLPHRARSRKEMPALRRSAASPTSASRAPGAGCTCSTPSGGTPMGHHSSPRRHDFSGEIPGEMLEVQLRPGAPPLGDVRAPERCGAPWPVMRLARTPWSSRHSDTARGCASAISATARAPCSKAR